MTTPYPVLEVPAPLRNRSRPVAQDPGQGLAVDPEDLGQVDPDQAEDPAPVGQDPEDPAPVVPAEDQDQAVDPDQAEDPAPVGQDPEDPDQDQVDPDPGQDPEDLDPADLDPAVAQVDPAEDLDPVAPAVAQVAQVVPAAAQEDPGSATLTHHCGPHR